MKRLLFLGIHWQSRHFLWHIVVVFLTILFAREVAAQSLPSMIFSPIQKNALIIPYAEIDYLSVPMQGLGYQLYNLAGDEVTELFRNPATLYYLKKSLFILSYEQPYKYSSSQPLQRVVGNITYPGYSIYPTYSSSTYYRSTRIRSPKYTPYLSAGFWTPSLGFLKTPAGLFFRANLWEEKTGEPSGYPTVDPFDEEYSRTLQETGKVKEALAQFWLGIWNRQNFRLAVAYNLFYYTSAATSFYRQWNSYTYRYYDEKHIFQDITTAEATSDWLRHRFSLGAQFNPGEWKIEPKLSFLMYSNEETFNDANDDFSLRYPVSNPDSIFQFQKNFLNRQTDFERDLTGLEIDFQAHKGKTTLFLTASYTKISPREHLYMDTESSELYYQDTLYSRSYASQFKFDDEGRLGRVRGGIGRTYRFKEYLKFYTAAIAEYDRHELSGSLPGSVNEKEQGNDIPATAADTTLQYAVDFKAHQLRLLLPAGFEAYYKIFSARFGVMWYYWEQKEKAQLQDTTGEFSYLEDQYGNRTFQETFFGLGLKWKRAELNIAAFSNVWEFSYWNVGLCYRF